MEVIYWVLMLRLVHECTIVCYDLHLTSWRVLLDWVLIELSLKFILIWLDPILNIWLAKWPERVDWSLIWLTFTINFTWLITTKLSWVLITASSFFIHRWSVDFILRHEMDGILIMKSGVIHERLLLSCLIKPLLQIREITCAADCAEIQFVCSAVIQRYLVVVKTSLHWLFVGFYFFCVLSWMVVGVRIVFIWLRDVGFCILCLLLDW